MLGARYANQWMNASTTTENSSTHDHFLANEQGLIWHQTSNLEFYLRRDTDYRFINGKEKLWGANGNINNVQMQTGISYETGLKWHQGVNKFEFGIYRLDLNNEITYTPDTNNGFGTVSNLPPTRRIGLNIYDQASLSKNLILNTQASLVRARVSSGTYAGKQVPAVSPISAGLGLTYTWPKDWSFNIMENYYSSSYPANDLDNKGTDQNGSKVPGYFLTDLNIRKKWEKLTINLSIKNLFNKNYARYSLYSPAMYTSDHQQIQGARTTYYPADGITALFTIEYNWA
ncbi:hypothetical protein BGC07_12105 [Piscirickettsia litoralis]|uniref:TonB-dependent receptor-like beta-barrel domain-containing protein n=1 Tax=Piscirickettsia litoralis TaxID=1891921 RepID=A0ABX3A7X6_9GAMM|nr:hypothetical protein BGC07_12105 [Piscirickettsia litoralis]